MIPQYCIAHPYCAQPVYVNNERHFPLAKLDSEINVRFLLNEHVDLYFLLHNNSVHIVLLNFKEN